MIGFLTGRFLHICTSGQVGKCECGGDGSRLVQDGVFHESRAKFLVPFLVISVGLEIRSPEFAAVFKRKLASNSMPH